MKRRLRNTASGKYAIGYFIFTIISVAIVILSFALLNDVRSTYSSQNDYLFVINELEQSVTSLNENVYTAYVSMSHEQIDQYDALRDKCESSLDKSKSASSDYYLREVVDLNNTVMTYLDASDELIRGIREYLETRSVDNLGELQKQYSEQQRIYSYVVIGFQNAYSARLSFLNNMQDQIEDSILRIVYSVTALLIAAGLFAGGYAVKSMRSMKHSFDVLEDGIDAFKKDVRNAPMIELHTSDEFEELADAFNNSQIVIRNQMDSLAESARDKEKLAEMEKENLRIYGKLQKNNLDFLQARINPHFLFNTLNMITAQANIENADKTAELLETTAEFLRYNLDNISNTVTMQQEFNNLQDYIKIEKTRYGDRFRIETSISRDVYEQHMPCMVLQPLVENSISHGVGTLISGGWITIRAFREDSRVIMEVTDNGNGMSEEQIHAMYESLKNGDDYSKHIGIRNIYRRLQLFYNNDVNLTLQSQNPGLCIRISVPLCMQKESGNMV